MTSILHSIEHLVDTYDDPDFKPDELATDGGVAAGAVLMKGMRDALERVRRRVCKTCEGDGFVANPNAHYEQDYCAGRPTGVYSTNDPEEIDCPDCSGVGFVKRKPVLPPRLPAIDEEIAF